VIAYGRRRPGRDCLASYPSPRVGLRAPPASERAPPSASCCQLETVTRLYSLFLGPSPRLVIISVFALHGDIVRARPRPVAVALDRGVPESRCQSLLLLLLELADFLPLPLGFGIGVTFLVALIPMDVLVGLPPADRRVDGVPEVVFCCQIPAKWLSRTSILVFLDVGPSGVGLARSLISDCCQRT
jgi:hypothetical protein